MEENDNENKNLENHLDEKNITDNTLEELSNQKTQHLSEEELMETFSNVTQKNLGEINNEEPLNKKIVKNGFSYEKDGWVYMAIQGEAFERGLAYGSLCAKEFKEIQRMLHYFIYESYGVEWKEMVEEVNEDIYDLTKEKFHESFEEMRGIAEGCTKAGTETSLKEIIAWNFYMSIPYWLSIRSGNSSGKEGGGLLWNSGGGAKDRCSAFMAVGSYTKDGKIVCAHNSFTDFIDGQYMNVVLSIQVPEGKGFNILMQTSPCMIWSGTDVFVTSKGIIGTETTIGGFFPYEQKNPIGYRIRKAMQYGETLDDYEKILLEGNSGDYANSWLFADINTNEIMRIELGLKYHNTERKTDGYFIGFNAAYDAKIRNLECSDSGFYDTRRHQGARKVRLGELMEEYKGQIDLETAKTIIADHYDVYLHKKDNPCSRTVCSHYDLDAREYMSDPSRPKPFSPHGAVDGFVVDSAMAAKMGLCGRFGNSCGIPFDKNVFCDKNMQWDNFRPYLNDRPTKPWSQFYFSPVEKEKEDKEETPETNETNETKESMLSTQHPLEQSLRKKKTRKGGRRNYKKRNTRRKYK